MRVYRIARSAYQALDGEGARLYGGRWNSPGRAMIYTSGTLALAALEYLVHVEPENAPDDLVALTIEIPEASSVRVVTTDELPLHWERATDIGACKAIGDKWLVRSKGLVLQVPSAPVPSEHNYLINPAVEAMSLVKIVGKRRFVFDPRPEAG